MCVYIRYVIHCECHVIAARDTHHVTSNRPQRARDLHQLLHVPPTEVSSAGGVEAGVVPGYHVLVLGPSSLGDHGVVDELHLEVVQVFLARRPHHAVSETIGHVIVRL